MHEQAPHSHESLRSLRSRERYLSGEERVREEDTVGHVLNKVHGGAGNAELALVFKFMRVAQRKFSHGRHCVHIFPDALGDMSVLGVAWQGDALELVTLDLRDTWDPYRHVIVTDADREPPANTYRWELDPAVRAWNGRAISLATPEDDTNAVASAAKKGLFAESEVLSWMMRYPKRAFTILGASLFNRIQAMRRGIALNVFFPTIRGDFPDGGGVGRKIKYLRLDGEDVRHGWAECSGEWGNTQHEFDVIALQKESETQAP